MLSKLQLVSYINKVKAESKLTLYKGRRVKSYLVPGSEDALKVLEARQNLFALMEADDYRGGNE